MPDITNYDGRLEQMANYCEQMLDNIAKVNNVYHDSVENAYAAALPDKFLKWKTINKIGGKTLVWNQLVDSGTTTVPTISGHKYYTLIDGTASIVTSDGTAITIVDDTADMVCDLTLCFGSGNEPATTNAFTDVFPATHYDYEPGTLLSAGLTEVDSKDSSDNTLQTYSVPAEVQAIEGYGWSAGTAYNYVDYERKKFVKCVDRIDMGTMAWTYVGSIPGQERFYSGTIASLNKPPSANNIGNLINKNYVATSYNDYVQNFPDKICFGFVNGNIGVRDTSYTDKNTFTSAMSGTYLFYELDEPVETDISEYLTDENITKAEAGGSITFVNQHGEDYKIQVPVEMEYIGL